MPNATPSRDTIFCEAIEIGDAADRAAYLAQACGGDDVLRQRVEALVAAHFQAGSFLEPLADTPDATAAFAPTTEEPGTVIGPYKLLERIGEGGMGEVYVAEQTEPVRRRVALKVIKAGMDTKEVVARFEAERQALALMDHPHIAKVLDAGATAAGRPYFVMELVRGLPVTEYCDQARLPPARRLRLFGQVCRAVQHAHQKGVIHRDIKPSNVLVTLHDGEPVPKVIDFGVAKAVNQRLTDKTVYTQLAQMIGTPLYMSPEQAELSGLDIDTRSDVYSLGVLLYELLTGSTPFDADTLRRAGFDEMRRMIREDEPARPSARFSTLEAAARSTVSARRGLDDRHLGRQLHSDLDWLVMKALEKDRNRRYESAGSFAADVERYLANEPVQARAPSAAYRLRKFAQRNKVALSTAAILAVAVLTVAGSLGWSLRDTAVRRWAAEGAATAALAESVDHHRAGRPEAALASAKRAVDTLAGVPGTDGLVGVARERVAELEMAARLEDRWLEGMSSGRFGGREATAGATHAAFRDFGIDPTVLPVAEAAERIRQRLIVAELVNGLDDWEANLRRTGGAADPLAVKLRAVAAAADPDPWRRRVRELVLDSTPDQVASLAAELPVDVAPPETSAKLGNRLHKAGRAAEAEGLLRRAARFHPGHVHINFTMADVLMRSPAEPARLEALGFYRAALSSRPRSPVIMDRVGVCLTDHLGRPAEGAEVFREVIRLHPDYFLARNNLSVALRRQGKHAEAVAVSREAVAVAPRAYAYYALGKQLRELGRKEEAAETFRAAVRCEPQTAEDHVARGLALNALGRGGEAIPVYKEAILLRPDFADAYRHLGFELYQRGADAEALTAYRQALKYAPDKAGTHNDIGNIFSEQERLEEAIAAYKEAIRIKPDYPEPHYNLGRVLDKLNRLEEAVAANEQVIKLRPTFAEAHCNLGHVFLKQGQYAKSLVAHRRGHELGAKNPAWPYPSTQWVETAERLTALAPRLPAILSGADDPVDPADAVAAAFLAAIRAKSLRAAELFRAAFTKHAALSDNPKTGCRYDAACSAACAGCGQGEGAVGLDDVVRAGWRRQALEWLRAELIAREEQLADGTPASPRVVEAELVQWQRDADLAGVRDTAALTRLPQAEHTEWKQFWADVRSTLDKARAPAEKID